MTSWLASCPVLNPSMKGKKICGEIIFGDITTGKTKQF
jgi:hypothetical protein